MITNLLLESGYTKKDIKGEYRLIGSETIENITEDFVHNIKYLPEVEIYLNSYRNLGNKVEITNPVTVYSKGILNIEVIGNMLFYYI